jgi:hypothetical protein
VNRESSWTGGRAMWSSWRADECGAAANQRWRTVWGSWRRAAAFANHKSSWTGGWAVWSSCESEAASGVAHCESEAASDEEQLEARGDVCES